MKSLLIVGYPKGFTSKTYVICQQATGLKETGVSAGEILNWERNPEVDHHPFVDRSEAAYQSYAPALRDKQDDYILKDVVQPRVVLRFLDQNPDSFNVLYVHRNPEDVMLAQQRDGWTYYPDPREFEREFLRFKTVEYERALTDPEAIFSPLRDFGYQVQPYNYITERFRAKTRHTRFAIEAIRQSQQATSQ